MRAYMAFSRAAGTQESAILVVHHTSKKAKILAWQSNDLLTDEWTDLAMRWMRDETALLLADQDKLLANEPHVIDSPAWCESCELWGCGITADGLCAECGMNPGTKLLQILHSLLNENKQAVVEGIVMAFGLPVSLAVVWEWVKGPWESRELVSTRVEKDNAIVVTDDHGDKYRSMDLGDTWEKT